MKPNPDITERDACNAAEEARPMMATRSVSRPLRTITLVEQAGDDGLVRWALIESSNTLFGLDEPNVLHAVSQQLFHQQTRRALPIQSISREAFEFGMGTGRRAGAQEERSRTARARVEAEEAAAEKEAAEAKRAARRSRKPAAKTTAKRRAR